MSSLIVIPLNKEDRCAISIVTINDNVNEPEIIKLKADNDYIMLSIKPHQHVKMRQMRCSTLIVDQDTTAVTSNNLHWDVFEVVIEDKSKEVRPVDGYKYYYVGSTLVEKKKKSKTKSNTVLPPSLFKSYTFD
jgi:hypothetical protein